MSIGSQVDGVLHSLQSADIRGLLLEIEDKLPSRSTSSAKSRLRPQDAEQLLQDSFLDQCEHFLKENHRFNQFTKKIECRTEQSLREIEKAEKYMQLRTSVDLQVQVARVVEKSRYNSERQSTQISYAEALDQICQLLEMPQDYAATLRDSKDKDTKALEADENFGKAIEFILRQKQLIDTLNASTQNASNRSLVVSMEASNAQLSALATAKSLKAIRQLAQNEPAFTLIRHYEKLFRLNPSNWQLFIDTYFAWRVDRIKEELWPMVTPLDYSLQQPLQTYYSTIFSKLDGQLKLEKQMIEGIMSHNADIFPDKDAQLLLQQVWPACAQPVYSKLERNFLKCADLLALVTIKRSYHQHIEALKHLFNGGKQPSAEDATFQPVILNSAIVKLVVCIDSQIKAQTEKLTSNKYNIYSVSSYLIISDHLKTALECYQINRPYVADPSNTSTSFIQSYLELASTRQPNETNKSLVLFNLNIWQLFIDIWGHLNQITDSKGQLLVDKATHILAACTKMLTDMNIADTKNQFFANTSAEQKKVLTQLLTICSADIKKPLHSELSLIIHPKLRLSIRNQLDSSFLKLYQQEIGIIQPMDNVALKQLCTDLQVNIKALGKAADTVRIYTLQEMKDILEN